MPTPDLDRRRTVVERSRERARRLVAEALAAHDPDARTLDPRVIEPPRYFEDSFPETFDEQLDRWGGIAGALVVEDGEVLCVDVGYRDVWQTPGGDVERGESLSETAVREVKEETNVDAEITGVFYARHVDIDYGPPAPVRIPMVVFTAEKVGGRRAVPAHKVPSGEPEIVDARWFGPDELPEDLTDRELIRGHLE